MRPTFEMPTAVVSPTAIALGRILLIDDEPKIRGVVSRALEAEGYAVDVAPGGAAGLRAALEQSYDLVIRVRPTQLTGGGVTLNLISRQAQTPSGPVPLAQREFRLLLELLAAAGETLTKERLLASVWGYRFDPRSNVVDVNVRRLRAKLGNDVIKTVRGEGYRID